MRFPKVITSLVIGLTIFLVAGHATALQINRNFTGGTAPVSAAGGGTLSDVFDAAADWWEMALLDNHTVSIDFNWAPLSVLGEALVNPPRPSTSATIKFDNDGSTSWFVDSTPHEESEWLTFTEFVEVQGTGPVNEGRKYTDPTGDAVGRYDLLTVAKHEIGHALNVIDFSGDAMSDPLAVTAPRPEAGFLIDTTAVGGGHIDPDSHPEALMVPVIPIGVRKLQSGVDILAVAERSGFTNIVLNPVHVPEPSSVLLTAIGFFALLVKRRRRAV